MRRIMGGSGLILVLGLLVYWGLWEQAPKVYRVGVLHFTNNNLPTLEGFKEGMRKLGYVEGEQIHYLFEGAAQDIDMLQPMAQRLVSQKPDLIFASTTPATLMAKKKAASIGIPVVFAPVNDPIATGVLNDLRHPGGDITGVRLGNSDPKRLTWLLKVDPSIKTVLVPFNATDSSALTTLKKVRIVAKQVGVELLEVPVTSAAEVTAVIKNFPPRSDAIFLPRDGLVMSRIKDFSKAAIQHKVVLSTPRYKQVEAGALMGFGFRGYDLGKQAARMADQILRGARAGDLPVETGEDYLFINLRTARAIGLQVPSQVLRSAYQVIQ
ncbi:ABC transporter substrate-binding protein [Magnetococcus sp. PR-3]|uniref:ABC transporter substrate-binding protein n=1 Tax=Magnetococcus sp. PR-3 TaxID=3120355 RepID=UPI002FCDF36F